MNAAFESRLQTVDDATLTPLVRRLLDNDKAVVTNWRYRPVEGGFGSAYGVYRFQGEAQAEGKALNWSLILKVMGPGSGSHDPSAMGYWKREMLVYHNGLLDDLPGDLVAPRCLDIVEYPDQECRLWKTLSKVGTETGRWHAMVQWRFATTSWIYDEARALMDSLDFDSPVPGF